MTRYHRHCFPRGHRSGRPRRGKSLVVLLCLLATTPVTQGREDLSRYQVEFEGVKRPLRTRMQSLSLAVELRGEGPVTPGILERRARKDTERFQRLLHSMGHFAASASYRLSSRVQEGSGPYLKI